MKGDVMILHIIVSRRLFNRPLMKVNPSSSRVVERYRPNGVLRSAGKKREFRIVFYHDPPPEFLFGYGGKSASL